MKSGRVSQTALKVAGVMVTLGAKPGWDRRLPEGLAELSEHLLRESGQFPFSRAALRLSRQPIAVRLAELGERLQPGSFEGIGRRKIFMNEQVEAAIAAGAEQVMVLGAGFDTLCLRLAPRHPALMFLELDHPDTSTVKRRAVARIGQPQNMHLLAADLGHVQLTKVLSECPDWDSCRPSVVVAEGLLYYLSGRAVRALFAALQSNTSRGCRVAFSYLFEAHAYPLARAALRLGGEPWLSASSVARLPEYVGEGWEVIVSRPGRRRRDLEGLAVAASSPRVGSPADALGQWK